MNKYNINFTQINGRNTDTRNVTIETINAENALAVLHNRFKKATINAINKENDDAIKD